MGCNGLGVLIDTSVFIGWYRSDQPYNRLKEPIENNSFYLVICPQLNNEYLRQLSREHAAANEGYLKRQLRNLTSSIYYVTPVAESLFEMYHKDQAHLNCAHNEMHRAHILVSDDAHFKEIKDNCPLPIILTIEEFLNPNMRTRACGDAVQRCSTIRQVGLRRFFSQNKDRKD